MSNDLGSYIGQFPVGLTTSIVNIKGVFSIGNIFNRLKTNIWPKGTGPREVFTSNGTFTVPPGATSVRISVQGQNGGPGGTYGYGGYLKGTIPGPNLVPTYYVRFGTGSGARSGTDRPSGDQPARKGGDYVAVLTSPTISDPAIVMIAGGGGGAANSAGGPGLGVPGTSSNRPGGTGGNQPSYNGAAGTDANVNGDESGDGGGGGGGGYRGGSGGAAGHYGGNGNWNEQSSGGGGGSSYINPIVTSTESQINSVISSGDPEFNSSNAASGGNVVYIYVNY